MSRFFEEQNTAENYLKYRPGYSSEVVDRVISFLAEKRSGPYDLALDVGCGSGQLTRKLSPHFTQVLGVDISEAQINAAHTVKNPQNISFKVGVAESLPIADASVDLITSATASHYFNWEIFGKEVDRVLKPNGCLVALSYDFFYIKRDDDVVTKQLSECIESYMDYMTNSELLKSTPHDYVTYRKQYKENLPLAYSEQERINTTMAQTMSVKEFIEFHKTWANFVKLQDEDPETHRAHFKQFENRVIRIVPYTMKTVLTHANKSTVEERYRQHH